MIPFSGASVSWIDENILLSLEAGLMKSHSAIILQIINLNRFIARHLYIYTIEDNI